MGEGFQFIDIIFFAMIAAFLVLRLRSVLGRRDGHEQSFRDLFKSEKSDNPENNVAHLSDRADPYENDASDPDEDKPQDALEDDDPLAAILSDVWELDPKFDPKEFIEGAKVAFEYILDAYAAGDTKTLESLLSPEVFENFSKAIRDRELAGETLEDTLVGIKAAEIVEAVTEGRMINITAKFVSEQINATRDEDGNVIDGNPNAVTDVTDFWTFTRDSKSRDPNWILIATSSLD
ncbi:MAG: Tim44 domain-containing protein [Rhodospirillales bacterium]|nr:Tim44 domain-containing protein [Rhodospirillales bacterium]